MKRCKSKIKSIKNQRFAVIHANNKSNNSNAYTQVPNSNNIDFKNCSNGCPFDIIKQDGEVEFQNLSSVMVNDG